MPIFCNNHETLKVNVTWSDFYWCCFLVFIAIALANIGVQGTSRGQKHIQSDCMYAYRRIGSSSSSACKGEKSCLHKRGLCCRPVSVRLFVRPSVCSSSSRPSSRFIERITQTPLMRYVSYCAANRRCTGIYSCCCACACPVTLTLRLVLTQASKQGLSKLQN